MIIGSHLSIASGYEKAAKIAIEMHANTFQFFTRNPRGGSMRAFDSDDTAALRALMEEYEFGRLLAHAPYTMNLCSSKESALRFAKQALKEDIERLEMLPCQLYNLHPGSHTGIGVEKGTQLIIEALNEVLKKEMKIKVLLETMSGKGTEIGSTFEELRAIIDGVECNEHLGICMDTCHIYSAGYDIVNDLDGVLEEFDRVIGLDRLSAVHLNDSKTPFASKKDRHETLGKGSIGLEALVSFINHPAIRHLPILLETPVSVEEHAREIELLLGTDKD
ncbi:MULTISPECIES: deoxyribonuclease IV [unclassified Fusibacter]|uniref:deoxyribonuclease IV n=1 Tax=unclassified Fusibacter TaxID=2624464 RepID=UPI0010136CCC|nr:MULTISPECIES: deoxyribonuclease IV [unclassified Fusibacter]MCK8060985.1 deoxyribonuclease IV [Fusibacter sp. A2]NPE20561.1 deoxyribonuclease IV [Fusibacter sp. A1]RXV63758.1 deoxyribonuclease IV [Fusibacter sp. A1]